MNPSGEGSATPVGSSPVILILHWCEVHADEIAYVVYTAQETLLQCNELSPFTSAYVTDADIFHG